MASFLLDTENESVKEAAFCVTFVMTPLTFQCTVNISTSGTTFLLVSY